MRFLASLKLNYPWHVYHEPVNRIKTFLLHFISVTANAFCFHFELPFVYFLQVVSDAAGQGVSIHGNDTFNYWDWPNAVIFAATVITTIGEYSD